jgi:hypothetical protein
LIAAFAMLTIARQPDSGIDRMLQPIGEAAH